MKDIVKLVLDTLAAQPRGIERDSLFKKLFIEKTEQNSERVNQCLKSCRKANLIWRKKMRWYFGPKPEEVEEKTRGREIAERTIKIRQLLSEAYPEGLAIKSIIEKLGVLDDPDSRYAVQQVLANGRSNRHCYRDGILWYTMPVTGMRSFPLADAWKGYELQDIDWTQDVHGGLDPDLCKENHGEPRIRKHFARVVESE